MENITSDFIKDYYTTTYNEDQRFEKNSHKIEFITTMHYIEKYLFPGAKILEIGAGTGRYSVHLAKLGYDVTAVELLQKHIDTINEKVKLEKLNNIKVIQANALDLSMFADNSFDLVLNLGPMYHMFTPKDKSQTIDETLRVTKKTGLQCLPMLLILR